MTQTAPTPADFMRMTDGPDFDPTELRGDPNAWVVQPTPSESVDLTGVLAHLERIEAMIQRPVELEQRVTDLSQENAAYTEQAALLEQRIAETLEAIRKSTSKVANQVRDILQPEPLAPAPGEPDLEPLSDAHPLPPGPQCPGCERYFADAELLERHECSARQQQPAHDAPIEEWVAYAQARGLDVDPGKANRSQIRTMLGLAHPTVDAGEGGAV